MRPSSMIFTGGMRMPSWNTSVDSGIEPGVMPPTSAWWARLAAKNDGRRSPPVKMGVTSVMSGRCVPPP